MPPKSSRTGEYIETDNGNKISRRAQLHSTPYIVLAGKTVIQHDVVIRGDLVRQQQHNQPADPSKSSDGPASKTSSSQQQQQQQHIISIHLGRYVFVSAGCTLHPPSRLSTTSSSSITTNPFQNPSTTEPKNKNLATTSITSDLALRRQSAQADLISPTGSNTTTTTPSHQSSQTQIQIHYPLRISSHVYLGPNTHVQAASIGSHVHIGADCVVGNMVIIKDCVRVEDGTVLPANSVWRSGVVVAGRPGRVVGVVGDGWGDGGEGLGAGMEGWTRELWASVGNDKKGEAR